MHTTPVPTFSTQRGVPYAPERASQHRAEEARMRQAREREEARLRAKAEQEARLKAKAEQRERTLAHARYLDQVEQCWRERYSRRRS